MPKFYNCLPLAILLLCLQCVATVAQEQTPDPKPPLLEAASDEGLSAIAGFKFADNLECKLFAAEPDVANIVAIHRDYEGNFFVCETFRQETGVEDNRKHAHWMDEELAAQTVQDRIDYIRKYIPDADKAYTENDDRIRLLKDTDGDGVVDAATVFSDKYNKLEMGTGAGVLSYRGKVYYTCIPDLFELQDKDGDGVAEVRKSLHTGYGVRFAFRGHDMHGLIVGPDGRLYFSIGDRGYNISPKIKDPASGAVFRCELDGSDLEVVHTGLRNPQELAFDDYGNLFTCDNNSDSGDKARWTEIVDGGDSGWRMYYQYMEDRGPFNNEKIWHPFHDDSPAYIVPPVENISDGPSGLEYYPGTGFGDEYKGQFFLCDFCGDASQSGIRSFRSVPNGAFWKIEDSQQPIWNMLATDIDFGSDGKFYASDWVFGWRGTNKGRLYSFENPQHVNSSIVKEVERLLKEGLKDQATTNVEVLLSHVDQRVRQEAQFELVRRGEYTTLRRVAITPDKSQLARIHAIWGIGQMMRNSKTERPMFDMGLNDLLKDNDPQVICAATSLAAVGMDRQAIASLLKHENLRVRYCGSMALGKIGTSNELPSIIELLVDNKNGDPMVRHGAIMALKGIFERDNSPGTGAVAKLANLDSEFVRLAVVVAMRKSLQGKMHNRFGHHGAARNVLEQLLNDEADVVALESARAIYDLPVNPSMEALANQIKNVDRHAENDPMMRRIIAANFRVGAQANANGLAAIALNDAVSDDRRIDAVEALANWADPSSKDMLLHDWRPIDPKKRNVSDAKSALNDSFAQLSSGAGEVSNAAIAAAGQLRVSGIGKALEDVIWSNSKSDEVRASALRSYSQLDDVALADRAAMAATLSDTFGKLPPKLAGRALDVISKQDKAKALELIEKVVSNGEQVTQQLAVATLGRLKTPESESYIVSLLEKLKSNRSFAPALRLDIVNAASIRTEASVKEGLAAYVKSIESANDKSASFYDSLQGGNAEAGAKVFYGKTEVSCVRCHRIDGTGGKVGPELSGIALKRDRKYLLEAVVDPNKEIAEGYTQVKVLTFEGDMHTGIVKSESDNMLVLLDSNEKEIFINQDDVDDRRNGQSSMPDDLIKQLTKDELRDLVEFLSQRKTKPKNGLIHE